MESPDSGKKLVLLIAFVALLAGVGAWVYQYDATRKSTEFWGTILASLIARPAQVEIRPFEPPISNTESLWKLESLGEPKDLSRVRGMVHLRHELVKDRNYLWDQPVDPEAVNWCWRLEFADEQYSGYIIWNEDFSILARVDVEPKQLHPISCEPMAQSLREYFTAIEVIPEQEPASTAP